MDEQRNLPTSEPSPVVTTGSATSRRRLLRDVMIGGTGALVGSAAVGRSVAAGDSDAPDLVDRAFELGAPNVASSGSSLGYSGTTPLQGPDFVGVSLLSVGQDVPGGDDGNDVYPGAVGGYGKGNVPHGVHGSTVNPTGFGVIAANLAPSAGTGGTVPKGLGVASLSGSQLFFIRLDGAVVGPTGGDHFPGEMYVDAAGTLWFSVPDAGGGVRWLALASTASTGAYHPISPARAYDSRQSGFPLSGRLGPGENRVVSVADGHTPGGDVVAPDVVPQGATAAMINLTAADPTEQNYLSIAEGSAASTAASALNWETGTTQIANALVVPLDVNRQVRVFCGDQPGATHFIVDVFGYYA